MASTRTPALALAAGLGLAVLAPGAALAHDTGKAHVHKPPKHRKVHPEEREHGRDHDRDAKQGEAPPAK